MKAKAFMYVSVANFVAVTGIVFNEMSSHGWITEQQASGMAFVLQAWVLLIIASVLNDLLDLGIGSEDRFGRRGGLATGVLVVTFTVIGGYVSPGTVPSAGWLVRRACWTVSRRSDCGADAASCRASRTAW